MMVCSGTGRLYTLAASLALRARPAAPAPSAGTRQDFLRNPLLRALHSRSKLGSDRLRHTPVQPRVEGLQGPAHGDQQVALPFDPLVQPEEEDPPG